MRILYVSNLYPPGIGGAQVHLHTLARQMIGLGNQVSAIILSSRYRRDWLRLSTIAAEEELHYHYEGVAISQLGFSPRVRWGLLPWAVLYYPLMGPAVAAISGRMYPPFQRLAGTPAVIHASRIGREFLTRTALDFARARNIPFVLTPNHHPRWKGPLYREYTRIYREADALVALTTAEKETLVEQCGVAEQRVHVTGIGPLLAEHYSAERFRERYGLKGRFVLYLGQQLRYKGIGAVLAAAQLVWARHDDVSFVFVGPETAESRKLFRGVQDPRIHNLGQVDLETKTSALAACEFLCLPSLQESFGGVYVEAWSLGKTVIGGRIPPIACVISDGKDGLLSSQQPGELAEAIISLLDHPDRCRSMGEAGKARVVERYSWEQLARQTAAIYESL